MQIAEQIKESAPFGGTNVLPAVASCFQQVSSHEDDHLTAWYFTAAQILKYFFSIICLLVCLQSWDSAGIAEDVFVTWLLMEPQTIVWLPTIHRMAAAESG